MTPAGRIVASCSTVSPSGTGVIAAMVAKPLSSNLISIVAWRQRRKGVVAQPRR